MASRNEVTVRPATLADVPDMLEVFLSAFADSTMNNRCFPPSDPATNAGTIESISNGISECVIAQSSSSATAPPRILGWARWSRRQAPHDLSPKNTADTVPPSGDAELAARFFGANREQTVRNAAGRSYWFLSILVVHKDAQRKGVGAQLMRYGTERADQDGWISLLNGSWQARKLYESFGYEVQDVSDFGDDIVAYHMKREAKPKVA